MHTSLHVECACAGRRHGRGGKWAEGRGEPSPGADVGVGTDNAAKGTDIAVNGTDNAVNGTDNAVKVRITLLRVRITCEGYG